MCDDGIELVRAELRIASTSPNCSQKFDLATLAYRVRCAHRSRVSTGSSRIVNLPLSCASYTAKQRGTISLQLLSAVKLEVQKQALKLSASGGASVIPNGCSNVCGSRLSERRIERFSNSVHYLVISSRLPQCFFTVSEREHYPKN